MRILFFTLLLLNIHSYLFASSIKGTIRDEKGEPLSFASIYVKGTSKGTTSNVKGIYNLELAKGKYTIVVQYVGFEKQEFEQVIGDKEEIKNITLKPIETSFKELVIKADNDAGLKIIKKAIKNRNFYNKQVESYKVDAYVKTVFMLDQINKGKSKIGLSIEDDSNNKDSSTLELLGIQYLAETMNEVYFKQPNKTKIVVKSSRVSGKQEGYGLSSPLRINMYKNNVDLGNQITPRGILSPIGDGAPVLYKYELLGAYMESGKLINRIKVTPRRAYEPAFSGIIEIMDGEWRVCNIDFMLTKKQGLEFFDTLVVKQIMVPVDHYYLVKDQSMQIKLNVFGVGISGNLVNVFSDYNFNYNDKEIFNEYVKEYKTDALQKTSTDWDATRPLALDPTEKENYRIKDSIALAKKNMPDGSSRKTDIPELLFLGSKFPKGKNTLSISSILGIYNVNWNTMEGFNYKFKVGLLRTVDKYKSHQHQFVARYGFSNQQFNAKYLGQYKFGKTNKSILNWSGGRYVFQYNNQNPVSELLNSYYTLLRGLNYLKMYQAWFGKISYEYKHLKGLRIRTSAQYQHRQALPNSTTFSFSKKKTFSENYPVERITDFEPSHRALIAGIKFSYQPGLRYVKFPDRVEAIASNLPLFSIQYQQGLPMLQTVVDYGTWEANMSDDMDFNLWGDFNYNISIGGFLYNKRSFLADYTHFNGGQIILASPFLRSFQLSPYYLNSNTEALYTTLHAEHHFNGLLTNKIPLFNKLKWYLVAATNAYVVNKNNNYVEASIGLENVGFNFFRFLRVDGVVGYTNWKTPVYGVRIGFSGLGASLVLNSNDDNED